MNYSIDFLADFAERLTALDIEYKSAVEQYNKQLNSINSFSESSRKRSVASAVADGMKICAEANASVADLFASESRTASGFLADHSNEFSLLSRYNMTLSLIRNVENTFTNPKEYERFRFVFIFFYFFKNAVYRCFKLAALPTEFGKSSDRGVLLFQTIILVFGGVGSLLQAFKLMLIPEILLSVYLARVFKTLAYLHGRVAYSLRIYHAFMYTIFALVFQQLQFLLALSEFLPCRDKRYLLFADELPQL